MILETGKGVRVDPAKVAAILNWDWDDLNSKSAVRSFLGLCNFIRLFCYHASDLTKPLNRLLKKDMPFEKGPEQKEAFEALKKLATEAPVLAFFKPGRPTKVDTDASGKATGGTMSVAEQNYLIQDQELLAVMNTLKDFEPALWGTKFFVQTDHQALIYWSTKKLLSARQIRWSYYLANFDIMFRYRPGKDNVAADALSRKTIKNLMVKARELQDRTFALIPPEKIEPIAPIQIQGINALTTTELRGADLVDVIIAENEKQNLGRKEGLLVIPETTIDGKIFLCTALIREAHEPKAFAHAGQNKTLQLLKKEYYWQGLNSNIKQYIKNWLLHPLPIPKRIWEHVVVDGKSMPKDDKGYDYVWAFVCQFSKLLATLPSRKGDTAEILAHRYYSALYRFLGIPHEWISDNAGPFISKFLKTLNKLTGIKHRHGSSRHPQTQGSIEITNAELDQKLRFYVDKYQTRWREHLPALDLAHNAAYHSIIGMSPLEVVLGTSPRNPLFLPLQEVDLTTDQEKKALEVIKQIQKVQELAQQNAIAAQALIETQANKKRRPVDFTVSDIVYNAGPWTIVEKRGHSFILYTPPWYKGSKLFHADRLRKAAQNPLPQQQLEPEPPVEINREPEWEVEKILVSRLFGQRQRLQYQVS
ncbi:Uu.00g065880.m01.CDS01 [Anthostomella pinea]|uniref:Uu.00g065880.m01.CDS01 n=1 Tax=Anthostomella pinea TaxID=933095 RepID=A0AAI8VV18_9PEZI|nr:Uu.00g065880.m01.CDS01 [Anthostomella pinea]